MEQMTVENNDMRQYNSEIETDNARLMQELQVILS
jgi:hypothetical protein